MHVTLTGGTEKHLWARLIALKSVPVQTGPLARSPLVCVCVCSGEQRQKGSNIESQQSRRIKDGRFWAHKRVSDAELFLVWFQLNTKLFNLLILAPELELRRSGFYGFLEILSCVWPQCQANSKAPLAVGWCVLNIYCGDNLVNFLVVCLPRWPCGELMGTLTEKEGNLKQPWV